MLQLNWKSAATVATGATALAGWLVTPAAPAHDAPRAAVAPRAPATRSLEQEAARLGARIRATAAFEQPHRDPFRFPPPAPPASARRADAPLAAAAAAPLPPAVPVFPFRLTGVAIDGAVHTAVLSSDSLGLALARPGDLVAGSYRVERVEDDAVDLVDTRDGAALRLTLDR